MCCFVDNLLMYDHFLIFSSSILTCITIYLSRYPDLVRKECLCKTLAILAGFDRYVQ